MSPSIESLLDFLEIADFDFHLEGWRKALKKARHRGFNSPGCTDVVFLDDDSVAKTEPVVAGSANDSCRFFKDAQARGCLAGVQQLGLGAFKLVDKGSSHGGDATHPCEKI